MSGDDDSPALNVPSYRPPLAADEYQSQSQVATDKALNGLKGYFGKLFDPEETTKTELVTELLKLKNPIQFAKFLDGESHLEG